MHQQPDHSQLPRLQPEAYKGDAQVHWSLTMADRSKGWLDDNFHWNMREVLVHASFRFGICCPMYCAMPDHVHLIWLGWRSDSDQREAMKYFRKNLNRLLKPIGFKFQKQPYDHVFRESERNPHAIADVADYVRQNPVRSRLSATAKEYDYSGCVLPGYPELNIWDEDYWERLWRVYAYLQDSDSDS